MGNMYDDRRPLVELHPGDLDLKSPTQLARNPVKYLADNGDYFIYPEESSESK
jgi:hypothetical protein